MSFTSLSILRKLTLPVGIAGVAAVAVATLTLRNDRNGDSATSITTFQDVSKSNGLLDIEALTTEEVAQFRSAPPDGAVSGPDAGEASPAEQFYRRLNQYDMEAGEAANRFAVILQGLSGSERGEFLSAIGGLLAPSYGGLLHKALLPRLHDHRERHLVAQAVISELLPDRAADAASWIAGLESGFTRQHAHESLGRQWAKEDLTGAIRWTDGLAPESDEKTRALEGVVWTWMQEDPAAVDTYIDQVRDPDLQIALTRKAVKVLAGTDPVSAIAWALDRVAPGDRRELLDYSVSRWAAQDYDAARHWVEQIDLADESVQHGAVNALVRVWSRQDPAAASAWIVGNQAASEHEGVLLQATRNWALKDPDGAGTWLSGIENAHMRELVMDNITRTLARKNPSAAKSWVEGIEDDALRGRGHHILKKSAVTTTVSMQSREP